MENNYCFADTVFTIKFNNERIAPFFRDFLTEKESETTVAITDAEIADNYSTFDTNNPCSVEVLLIHKAISTYLLEKKDGFLFHASSIKVGDKAVIFTALSGTGKSTQARHWKQCFGDEVEYINDDKPFIRLVDGTFYVYGSPWNGKHRLGGNIKAPVGYVCFLCRDEEDRVEKISSYEAIPLFLSQTLGFKEKENQLKVLTLLDKFLKSVKTFRIYCTDTDNSARIIRSSLEGF